MWDHYVGWILCTVQAMKAADIVTPGRSGADWKKGMLSAGGDRGKYLDSNELLENDDNFKAGVQDFLGGGEVPERVLLMTTEPLFHLFGEAKKISVDGTFRIAPSYWTQVFIVQVQTK